MTTGDGLHKESGFRKVWWPQNMVLVLILDSLKYCVYQRNLYMHFIKEQFFCVWNFPVLEETIWTRSFQKVQPCNQAVAQKFQILHNFFVFKRKIFTFLIPRIRIFITNSLCRTFSFCRPLQSLCLVNKTNLNISYLNPIIFTKILSSFLPSYSRIFCPK